MQAVLLFAVILVLIAAAFAIPNGMVKGKTIDDRDASVVGAAVLALGLGGLNFLFVLWFLAMGDIGLAPLAYGLLPLIAGATAVALARRRAHDAKRTLGLLACAVITLVGVFGYFAPSVSVVVATITALLFLLGVVPNPRQIIRSLDPRN
jgi:uncharacterized membrane protein YhaH (DUF805 family)